MESDAWDVGAGEVSVEELADRFGVDRVPVGVGEDRVGDLDAVSVATLVSSPPFEELFGGGVEVDAAWLLRVLTGSPATRRPPPTPTPRSSSPPRSPTTAVNESSEHSDSPNPVPWLVVALKIVAPNDPPGYSVPGFVYGTVASLFVLFNCFALVQWKQYRAKRKWANYLLGERTYIVLSVVADALLAW